VHEQVGVALARSASAARTNGATTEFVNCVRAFESEFDYVYRALKRHGVNPADAEDLAQEVFLVMWRRWADYDAERPLRPWLAGIAFKVAHDYRRRSGREVPGGLVDAEDQAPGAEEHLATSRARTLVLRALSSLPEKQRTLIVMHDLDGASMREIADILSVPLFTAYSRLRSARQAFAKAVRRLHTLAIATAGLERLPSPSALLRAERLPPPAPAEARRRAVSRVRSLAALPAPPPPLDDTPPPLPPSRGLPLAVGTGVVTLVGLVALVLSPRPPLPRGHHVASKARPAATLASRSNEARHPLRPSDGEALVAGLSRGLLAFWRFDDAFGSSVARDQSGNGNECTLRNLDPNTPWTDGQHGGAIALDGHGFLKCPQIETWTRIASDVTVAAWVRRMAPQTGVHGILSRQMGDDSKEYLLFGFTGDKLLFNSHVWGARVMYPLPNAYGRWVHVAATRSGDGTAKLFVDGQEVKRNTVPNPASIGEGANVMVIGAGVNVPDDNHPTEIFNGAIDDLLLYERALSDAEIGALAAGAQPGPAI
jgi:RNA polymerase sigma factor (sigma-70 family)